MLFDCQCEIWRLELWNLLQLAVSQAVLVVFWAQKCWSYSPTSLLLKLRLWFVNMDPADVALPEAGQQEDAGNRLPDAGTLREVAARLVTGLDLYQCSIKDCRIKIAVACGLEPDGLDTRKDEISALLKEVIESLEAKKASQPSSHSEKLGEECNNPRRAYLVTLSHTNREENADGQKLVAPGTFTRAEIKDFFLGALVSTRANREQPLAFTSMAVFQERHTSGEVHYHVALLADRCFRFAALKRHLLAAHGLASHWSGKTDGYAGCVAYCYLPSPTKALEELDPTPELWPSTHPPLSEASRGFVSAKNLEAYREDQRRQRAGKGKAEQRVREVDLWPIIIRENILPDEVCAEKLMAYAKRAGGRALVEFCFANWDKLPAIVAKSWKTEKVEDLVAEAAQNRMEILEGACSAPCTCGGQWSDFACSILSQNGHDPLQWCKAVADSLLAGRSKGNLVCHAGFEGNEGKSFLFRPLPLVFGEDNVFVTPPKSAFPLLGLEKARVVWLDDWRFNEDIVPWAVQLLWFEGASFVIARPQNLFSGHLRYVKDDPLFITTLHADLHALKGKLKQGDLDMMVKRLKVFDFKQKVDIPSHVAKGCSSCFARFVLGQNRASHVQTAKREATPSGETPEPKRMLCLAWTVDDVCKYIADLELGHVVAAFRENAVDGRMLASLSEDDLISELGLKVLQARKVKERLT